MVSDLHTGNLKIVVISDLHGTVPDLPDGDVLIIAGDSLLYGYERELLEFNRWLGTLPHEHKIVIAGNHDICLEAGSGKHLTNCTYLQDESVEIAGLKIYGAPWTPEYFNWSFMLPRNRMHEVLEKIPDDTDILVTHGPPQGILDNIDGELTGCRALLERVREIKPQYHIFGHIHPEYGTIMEGETTFINASLVNDSLRLINAPIEIDMQRRD